MIRKAGKLLNPRILYSSRTLPLAFSINRILYPSPPLSLASPFPRVLSVLRLLYPSHPLFHISSIPRVPYPPHSLSLNVSCIPQVLYSSHPRFFASPKGRILRSSHPQSLASFLPQGFVLERICYCNPQGVALRTLPLLCNL